MKFLVLSSSGKTRKMIHFCEADVRQHAVEAGIRALLRDRILQAYYHYSERKWITLHGLENVNALYKEYHALGGNGAVTKLVEDLRELEVRDG